MNLKNVFAALMNDESGQDLIEYALVAGLIGLAGSVENLNFPGTNPTLAPLSTPAATIALTWSDAAEIPGSGKLTFAIDRDPLNHGMEDCRQATHCCYGRTRPERSLQSWFMRMYNL